MKTIFQFSAYSKISFILLIGLASCKLPSIQQSASKQQLPEQYSTNSDTSNSASLSRTIFYNSVLLNNLIDTVLANNYDYRISLQRIESTRASVKQSRGLLMPQVNGMASPSLRKFGLYTMDGAGNIVTEMEGSKLIPIDLPDFYLGLQSTWEIDVWGKLKQRKKAALSRVLASDEGRKLIQTTLVAETASAYYSLMAEDQMLKLLDETIVLQEQAINTVKIQKQTAVVNELAVQQFEAQLLSMRAMRIEALQKINELENKINILAGRFTQRISRDSLFFQNDRLPMIKTGIPSQLLLNRPDIRQMEWELQAAKADLVSARAALMPSLMLTGGLGLQAYRTGLLFTTPQSVAYSLIGGLTGPIINRNAINAEYNRSNAMQKEALLEYEKTINTAVQEVDQEIKNLNLLQSKYTLKAKEKDVLSSSVDISSELFRTGRATYLEVLITRQNALRSNIELIDTRMKQYISAIQLYRKLGGGWR